MQDAENRAIMNVFLEIALFFPAPYVTLCLKALCRDAVKQVSVFRITLIQPHTATPNYLNTFFIIFFFKNEPLVITALVDDFICLQ